MLSFYVAAGDAPVFNDATQVVVMRHGSRTVLTLQPTYRGPAEPFAIVIPVPAQLQDRDVKVLAPDVVAAVERLGAPRLVEMWEQDPCKVEPAKLAAATTPAAERDAPVADAGVTVEARTTGGEYQIAIVAAKDAAGLAAWLAREKYRMPAAAEALLRPHVERGMKFVVAKVDPKQVTFIGDRAVLSPLRLAYDSERLALPLRLGLVNSAGTQDLIVNVLARRQRYEAANAPNATIPTNRLMRTEARDRLAAVYADLFDATAAAHPGAVITEYAGDASALGDRVLRALGTDVLGAGDGELVLSRLHTRYDKSLESDLELAVATPIAGGREVIAGNGALEAGAHAAPANAFSARYVIRHPWNGPLTCAEPVRGRWRNGREPILALDLASAPRDTQELASAVVHDLREADRDVLDDTLALPASAKASGPTKQKSGCGCQTGDASGSLLVGLLLLLARRRR